MFDPCATNDDLSGTLVTTNTSLYGRSFDSGYSGSPVHQVSQQISKQRPSTMDENNFFMTSPNKFNLNSNNILTVSPMKTEPVSFSPFKDSSLSPFKLINQSPSKGSFDDWDKDFIASFEENLFGIGDLSENTVEELLKSPKGKALLERTRSPGRPIVASPLSKRIRVSPLSQTQSGNRGLFLNGSDVQIKQENIEHDVKVEDVENDHLYGQTKTYVYVNTNGTLSAIDPNKMSATPIKRHATHVESAAPKRKLAMKTGVGNPVQAIIFQSNQIAPVTQANTQTTWPSKERLNFARMNFQKVLNDAVEKERQILREIRLKNEANKKPTLETDIPEKKKKTTKSTGGKTKKTISGKGKGKGKRAAKKEKYPEISMALSKPVHSRKRYKLSSHNQQYENFVTDLDDMSVYSDEEEIEVGGWDGRPPFYSQMSTGFDPYSENSSDDDWTMGEYKFETFSGARIKKRKR